MMHAESYTDSDIGAVSIASHGNSQDGLALQNKKSAAMVLACLFVGLFLFSSQVAEAADLKPGLVKVDNKTDQEVWVFLNYFSDKDYRRVEPTGTRWRIKPNTSTYLTFKDKRINAIRVSYLLRHVDDVEAPSRRWRINSNGKGDLVIPIEAKYLPEKPANLVAKKEPFKFLGEGFLKDKDKDKDKDKPKPKPSPNPKPNPKPEGSAVVAKIVIHNDTVDDVKLVLRSYVASNGKSYFVNEFWEFEAGEEAEIYRGNTKNNFYASLARYTVRTKYGDKLWYMTNTQKDEFVIRISKDDTARPYHMNFSDIGSVAAKAKQGDAEAMGKVGELFIKGLGGAKDNEANKIKGANWAKKASDKGDPRGIRLYGWCLDYGHGGVKKNQTEAFKLYKRAAALGELTAIYNVGSMYALGEGVTKNLAEAYKYYVRAAEKGDPDAQRELGFMYELGRHVRKNYQKAAYWLGKAAAQGDTGAMNDIGYMHYHGELGIFANKAKGISWYNRSAALGDKVALDNLRKIYAANRSYGSAPTGKGWYDERGPSGLRGSDALYLTNKANNRIQHGK